jgi:hypothetical protein
MVKKGWFMLTGTLSGFFTVFGAATVVCFIILPENNRKPAFRLSPGK